MTRISLGSLAVTAILATATWGAEPTSPQSPEAPDRVDEPEAAAPAPPRSPLAGYERAPNARVYECPAMDVVVAMVRAGVVALFLPRRTLFLSRVAAATHEQYTDGTVSLFVQDGEILLELEGEPMHCGEDRSRSLWEDAKLRGVDYRAVGNEPGWILEIGPEWVTFDYDYGTANAIFPALEPIVDAPNRRTVYAGESPSHRIQITIAVEPCHDTMVDKTYASSAEVMLDGRIFRGCGRALH